MASAWFIAWATGVLLLVGALVAVTPAVRLERVSFVPFRSSLPQYERCAVAGTLEPAVTPGLYATAQIVVYPAGA